jgi:uncharacterized protein HemX
MRQFSLSTTFAGFPVDNVDVKSILAVLTFLAGAGSATLAFLKSRATEDKKRLEAYALAEKKRYAAERDFNHLRNSQEQMKLSIKELSKEIDGMQADLQTQIGLFQALMINSNQTVSGIFAHKPKRGTDANDSP